MAETRECGAGTTLTPRAQPEAMPELFEHLDFRQFRLQPMDGPKQAENAQAAFEYCLKHPKWMLSLQTHKWINVP